MPIRRTKDNTETPKRRNSEKVKHATDKQIETFDCELSQQFADPAVVQGLLSFFNSGGTITFNNDNAYSLFMAADYLILHILSKTN